MCNNLINFKISTGKMAIIIIDPVVRFCLTINILIRFRGGNCIVTISITTVIGATAAINLVTNNEAPSALVILHCFFFM